MTQQRWFSSESMALLGSACHRLHNIFHSIHSATRFRLGFRAARFAAAAMRGMQQPECASCQPPARRLALSCAAGLRTAGHNQRLPSARRLSSPSRPGVGPGFVAHWEADCDLSATQHELSRVVGDHCNWNKNGELSGRSARLKLAKSLWEHGRESNRPWVNFCSNFRQRVTFRNCEFSFFLKQFEHIMIYVY